MVKSQRKESTDPRLNPDKMLEKRGEFAEECGEWRAEADYLLEHRPREGGGGGRSHSFPWQQGIKTKKIG